MAVFRRVPRVNNELLFRRELSPGLAIDDFAMSPTQALMDADNGNDPAVFVITDRSSSLYS